MSTPSSDRRPLFAAIALFAIALVIRLFGITWGLPNDLHNDSLHPDETVVYYNYSYPPSRSAFEPGNYNYPSLYPIVVRVAGDMVATYSNMDTPATSPDPVVEDVVAMKAYLAKMAPHERATNIAGRILNCLAAAGTTVVVFFLLLRFAGLSGAWFGGLLTAIAPSFVMHSRFQTVDVFAAFFFWLSIFYAIKIYLNSDSEKLDWRYALLSGMFAGLSMGTKYTGVVALVSLFIAIGVRKHPKWLQLASGAALLCVLVFVLTTPGVLLNTERFMFGVKSEAQHMREGHDFAFLATPSGFIYQLGNLFTGIGPLAFVIGLVGLAIALIKKHKWMWVILGGSLAYFLIIGPSQVKFARYGLPLVPLTCIGFGYAIGGALRRPNLKVAGCAVGLISVLGLESFLFASAKPTPYWSCFDPRFGGLVGTLHYSQAMSEEDPRDTAARDLFDKIKGQPNASVGILRVPWFWTVPVVKDATFLYNLPNSVNALYTQAYFRSTSNPRVKFAYQLPPPDYVVLTSLEVDAFERIKSRGSVPEEMRERYDQVKGVLDYIRFGYDVVGTFGGEAPEVEDLMYAQPKAYIYKRK